MTTAAQLKKTALALNGVSLDGTAIAPTYCVGGRVFAAYAADKHVELRLPDEPAARFLHEIDRSSALRDGQRPIGVRVAISDINGQALNYWVREAWLAHAPSGDAAAAQEAAAAAAGSVGDLPKAIGTPATRALVNAGITTLAQVADHDDDSLLALHGVGPRAVKILREQGT